jgi:RNA polymerase sigma-70 factor, ECF subfamily
MSFLSPGSLNTQMPTRPLTATDEEALLQSARRGDEKAYEELVESHRAELHAHCYRMLASSADADDAVQEAVTRAWRGLSRFEARSSVRTWLFKIATNTAIDVARHRSRRLSPLEDGCRASPGESPGDPLTEMPWIEPCPDSRGDASAISPEARYEMREGLELAFVVALQHLPPRQRAVLILRDVLGFSAGEVAALLESTVPAVNSALQRARDTAATRIPRKSQQVELRLLGTDGVRDLARRYADAIEKHDIETLLSMLTEDATWAMPPYPTFYRGRLAIGEFHEKYVFAQRWRHVATRANGQLAVGCYTFDPARSCYVASVLDVLTLDGGRISAVTGFITSAAFRRNGVGSDHSVESVAFPNFGLAGELPA